MDTQLIICPYCRKQERKRNAEVRRNERKGMKTYCGKECAQKAKNNPVLIENKKKIADMWNEGESITAIANHFNCSRQSMTNFLTKSGLKKSRKFKTNKSDLIDKDFKKPTMYDFVFNNM